MHENAYMHVCPDSYVCQFIHQVDICVNAEDIPEIKCSHECDILLQ